MRFSWCFLYLLDVYSMELLEPFPVKCMKIFAEKLLEFRMVQELAEKRAIGNPRKFSSRNL